MEIGGKNSIFEGSLLATVSGDLEISGNFLFSVIFVLTVDAKVGGATVMGGEAIAAGGETAAIGGEVTVKGGDAIALRTIGFGAWFETPNPVDASGSACRVASDGNEASPGNSGDTAAPGSGDVAGDRGDTKVSTMGVFTSCCWYSGVGGRCAPGR